MYFPLPSPDDPHRVELFGYDRQEVINKEPLIGYSDIITSVAFSSDGAYDNSECGMQRALESQGTRRLGHVVLVSRIVSGSYDNTIWNAKPSPTGSCLLVSHQMGTASYLSECGMRGKVWSRSLLSITRWSSQFQAQTPGQFDGMDDTLAGLHLFLSHQMKPTRSECGIWRQARRSFWRTQ